MSAGSNRTTRATEFVTTASAYVAGAVLVALMVLTTADVLGRNLFNTPLTGVFDLTHFAVSIMVFLGLAYCGFRGGHVVIELLFDRLGPVTQRGLVRVINFAGCVLFGLIAWRTLVQAVEVREMGEASQLMEIPFFPLYLVVAFGCALFAWVMGLRVFVPEMEHGAADAAVTDDPL